MLCVVTLSPSVYLLLKREFEYSCPKLEEMSCEDVAITNVDWATMNGIFLPRQRKGKAARFWKEWMTPLEKVTAVKNEVVGWFQKTPITIGTRLQLFTDDELIDRINGATLTMHHPEPRELALEFDQPWEAGVSYYVTVWKENDTYRMFYRSSPDDDSEMTGYAESPDGIHWKRPSLGLYSFRGSSENNIVWVGESESRESHNFSPFLDANPLVNSQERYKAIGGMPPVAFSSYDGIHWKKMGPVALMKEEDMENLMTFDSQNIVFWDNLRKEYMAYFRVWIGGVRSIAHTSSKDFITWEPSELIKIENAPIEQLYTNNVIPYFRSPEIYFSFPMRYVQHREGASDTLFMTSRDGIHFRRPSLDAFIRPGRDMENWSDHSNGTSWGFVPTADDELSLYVVKHYTQNSSAHLRRFTIRTDGFTSMRAPYEGGEFVTKPLVFSGSQLVINAATSAAGSVQVEIQDIYGQPIQKYTLEDSQPFYGDEIERVVTWRQRSELKSLEGMPVRLRFVLRDADLYSFRFAGSEF